MQEDLETLEVIDSRIFLDLSKAYRDLEVAINSLLGLSNKYRVIREAFGATISLNRLSILLDSLIYRVRYNILTVLIKKRTIL